MAIFTHRFRILICFIAVVSGLTRETQIAAQNTGITVQLRTADLAQASGEFAAATAAYESALQTAGPDDPLTRAQISIAYGQTLEAWARADPAQLSQLTRASELYRSALETGTSDQRQLARNNLGTLMLRQRQYENALQMLAAIDLNSEPPERRFVYEYNLGRALELNDRSDEAFDRYLNVVKAQPAFTPARDAALQMLKKQRPVNVDHADALGTMLIENGQPEAGAVVARALLPITASEATAIRLFRVLLRSYAAMPIDPVAFQRAEVPFLQSLNGSGRIHALALEIARAVTDRDLRVITASYQSIELFPGWFRNRPGELALLLKGVGDTYRRAGNYRQALARYAAAWALDRGNGEPAVYAAMLINDQPAIDPGRRVLDLLLEDIFASKADFIAAEDWPNSLRMHLVLGTIFEKLGQWGPEGNSHTAIFQWRAALDDERRILARDPSFGRSPGLYIKLGEAYLKLAVPQPQRAREQFVSAASAYEETGRSDEANGMRERARLLPP
jgi:tetratricopeptide (TPR) repeat protein